MSGLTVLWLTCATLNWKLSKRRHTKNLYHENSDIYRWHSLKMNSGGISDVTDVTKVELQWKSVYKVMRSEQGIYVLTEAKYAIIVPNSAFAEEHQRQEFLEAIMRYREQAAGLIAL